MEVTAHEQGITIELTPAEMADLAEFLGQFYEGTESVVDQLSVKLDAIIDAKA